MNKKTQSDFLILTKELFQILLVAGPILIPLLSYISMMSSSEDFNDILLSKEMKITLNSIAGIDYPSESYLVSDVGSRMIDISSDSFYISSDGRHDKQINSKLYPTYSTSFQDTNMYTTFSTLVSFERDDSIVGFRRFRDSSLKVHVPDIETSNYFWDKKTICFKTDDNSLRNYIEREIRELNSYFDMPGCDLSNTFVYSDGFRSCNVTIHLESSNKENHVSFQYSSREKNKLFALLFNEMVYGFEIYDYSMKSGDYNLIKFNFDENDLLYRYLHDAFLNFYGEINCDERERLDEIK